jgi:putative FmdB family regulatory protein
MPIYAYRCKDCEEPFELFVRSVNATVEPVCPKCGSEHIAKQVTAVSTVGAAGSGPGASAAACAPSG